MLDHDQIDKFLKRSNITYKDADVLRAKIAHMKQGGANKLQILADFDFTISHCHFNGERKSSSFGAIEKYSGMSEDFRKKTKALFDHYYAIEVDPNVEEGEKIEHMTQWFTKSSGCIIEEGISEEGVHHAVDTSSVLIRKRFDEFARMLEKNAVPLLVFSAGIGQVILRALENLGVALDNIGLIANMLEYNEKKEVVRFTPPLITTGNKAKVACGRKDYFDSHSHRTNSILLGDNIEDVGMAACVKEYAENVLKIGFLNDKVEERKSLYESVFDIVILNDPDFEDIIELLVVLGLVVLPELIIS